MVYAADYSIWHQRMGHPGDDILWKLPEIVKEAPKIITIPMAKKPCEACAKGKMPSCSFPSSVSRAMKPFQIVHSDLKDMIKRSFNGYYYVLTILDDFTSHAWSFNLKKKSDTIIHAWQFVVYAKNQHNASVGTWHFDGGTEFLNDTFKTMLHNNGILSETSMPYMHQQNGHPECLNCTIMDKAQSMHSRACLTDIMWEFSWDHAIHVYNHTSICHLKWQTPYEALRSDKLDVSHLCVFGCGAYVFLPEDVRANKLSPKSKTMVYLGQPASYKGFFFYHITNGWIFIGATAVFDETYFSRCPDGKQWHFIELGDEPPTENRYLDDPIDHSDDNNFGDHLLFPLENNDSALSSPSSEPEVPIVPDRDTEHSLHTQGNPPVLLPQWHDEDAPRCGTRQRTVCSHPDSVYSNRMPINLQRDNLCRRVGNQPGSSCAPPKQPTQNPIPGSSCAPPPPHQTTTNANDDTGEDLVETSGQVCLNCLVQKGRVEFIAFLLNKAVPLAVDQLVIYKDIARLPSQLREQWKKACQKELEALRKCKVFELANLPPSHKAIKNCWVFMTKSNGHKKARLVAKGFSQVKGIDFDQIFSLVVWYESICLLLAAAALEWWYIKGLDIKSAFLYGHLDEEIYMEQPEGFKIHGQEWKVLHLCWGQAIYGLKQAALAWWKELLASMRKIGFECFQSNAGIFIHKASNNDIVIAMIYVNDSGFMGNNATLVKEKKKAFMGIWECHNLSKLNEFLEITIRCSGHKIILDQKAYLTKVLDHFGMTNAITVNMPLPQLHTRCTHWQPWPHTSDIVPSHNRLAIVSDIRHSSWHRFCCDQPITI